MGRDVTIENDNRKCGIISATLDEAMLLSGFGIYNILHMFMSGFILMGMIIQCVVLGYVIPAAQCDLDLTTQQKGWLSALPFAAIIIMSYLWGWLGDTRGRRPVILYSTIGTTVLSLLASFAPELISFAVLQFLSSVFMTGSSSVLYAYLGEFNNLRNRDKMITFGSSFIGMGIVILPCLAWIILPLEFEYPIAFLKITYRPWRLLVVVASAPFAINAVFMLFAPETPKFLFEKGLHEDALEVVKKIYSINNRKPTNSFPVKSLILKDLNQDSSETKKKGILTSMQEQTLPLLRSPLLKWTCLICFMQFGTFAATNGFYIWFPTILNSLASSNVTDMKICEILDYNRQISDQVDIALNDTIICTETIHTSTFLRSIYTGLIFYTMYIIIGILVNFLSKKYLLLAILTTAGCCAIGTQLVSNVQIGIMLFSVFQIAGICVGLMSAVAVELFPTKYRAMGVCLSMMIGRIGSIMGLNLIGWLLEVNCGAGFYIFGGLLIANGVLCLILLPKNKKNKSTGRSEA